MDETRAKVGDNAPKTDDAAEAGSLTALQSMLEEHHARLGRVEKHLGLKPEKGVAKEERGVHKERKRH